MTARVTDMLDFLPVSLAQSLSPTPLPKPPRWYKRIRLLESAGLLSSSQDKDLSLTHFPPIFLPPPRSSALDFLELASDFTTDLTLTRASLPAASDSALPEFPLNVAKFQERTIGLLFIHSTVEPGLGLFS